MKLITNILTLLTLGLAFPALANIDELYTRLKQDFESKPHFLNENINEQRNGVMSSFVREIYDEDYNNARPLSTNQIKNLPGARMLDKKVFTLAMKGRERLLKAGKIKDFPILVVADFSKNSRLRRLYVMNVHTGEVIINTWVSHASNSDEDRDGYPETFSNVSGSNLSSLGFTVTDTTTYVGQWGYSLRIRGLDPKLNSNVYSRAVVFHGWNTMGAHEASWGKSATSMGCLMTSTMESGRFWGLSDRPLNELVINTIKGGALVFTYSDVDEENLIFQSGWINRSDLPKEEIEEEIPGELIPETVQDEANNGEPIVSHRNPFRYTSKPANVKKDPEF